MDVYVVLFRLRSLNVTDIVDRVAGMVNSFSVGKCRFIAIDSKCSLSVGKKTTFGNENESLTWEVLHYLDVLRTYITYGRLQ